jgi:hypothetical protein
MKLPDNEITGGKTLSQVVYDTFCSALCRFIYWTKIGNFI